MTKLGGIRRRDRTEPDVRLIPLDDLIIENRVRQNMGDIEGLAASIQERGLLQAILVRSDNLLLAGERRVRAVESLGWTEIPAMVVTGYDDLADRLTAERDENLYRKELDPEELVAVADRLTAALAPAAAARKAATQAKPGEQVGERRLARLSALEDKTPGRRVEGRTSRNLETRDQVAKMLGTSPRRLRRTREVMEATSDPDPEVQAAATEARSDMARTGQVDPAWRKVRSAKGDQTPATTPTRRTRRRPSSSAPVVGGGLDEFKPKARWVVNWLDRNRSQRADDELPDDFIELLTDLVTTANEWLD